MSVKNLFNKGANVTVVSLKNKTEAAEDLESPNYYSAKVEQKEKFEPHINYAFPANFANFGSAEKYYRDAITNIYTYYPFDGSLYERTAWELSASGIQKHIFEKEYPRTNGYIDFSYGGWGSVSFTQNRLSDTPTTAFKYPSSLEHITIYGGPNKDPDGSGKTLASIFENSSSNFYNPSENRESNLEFASNGNTIEFWMKKDAWNTDGTKNWQETVFDLWASGTSISDPEYGRFCVTLNSCSLGSTPYSPVFLTYVSGGFASGISAGFSGSNAPTAADLADGNWHHYAISIDSSTGKADLYVDGDYKDYVQGTPISEVTGTLIANIGSYYNSVSDRGTTFVGAGASKSGWSKLSASLDEFRFWKSARTDRDIGQYWFTQVGGGTNSDDANTDLGVYYKFNEGITLTSSIDSKVLDYSGRFSDATWTGYSSGARHTGSAMVLSNAADREFKDPIVYSFHPDVVSLLNNKANIGYYYDQNNPSSLYYSLPSWIIEEDDDHGDLLNLTQVISSYFDTLYMQMSELTKLKNVNYPSSSYKPYPFTNRALENLGFGAANIFVDADILEAIASRNNTEEFDDELWNIKNSIYQNIYNNLTYIYKTKGTMKSFRNLMRCYGIDEELVRINLYVDGAAYDIQDDYRLSELEKKFVNFTGPDRFNGTVYQSSSASAVNSRSYVTGSPNLVSSSWTYETRVLVPGKPGIDSPIYYRTPFVSASVFGQHSAKNDGTDFTWDSTDSANFQVYLVKEEVESKNAKFVLKSQAANNPFPTLETGYFKDIYNNTNWTLSVRVKPSYELYDTGSTTLTSSYELEFQGIETDGTFVSNSFLLTSSLSPASGSAFCSSNKRVYAGAHYTNFTGTILEQTDLKITNNRVWASYLGSAALTAHALDATNYGTENPYADAYSQNSSVSSKPIPATETLLLNWGYDNLSASDGGSGVGYTAGFDVVDLSSGSVSPYKDYGSFSDVLKYNHPGRGNKFLANDTDVIQKEFLSNAKLQNVENLQSDDLVEIISSGDSELYTRESRPLNYVYAIEKGMQQVISDEMINIFGSIVDFNNLIGEPVNRYRQEYRDMAKLRQIFFSRIDNTPSLIKYVDFYKWIDSSINAMLQQLIPATANFSDKIATVVESHVLERNKYYNKFPTLELEEDPPQAPATGINELLYPWKTGHGPYGGSESDNCFWWANRAEMRGQQRDLIISASHGQFNNDLNRPIKLSLQRAETFTDGVLKLDITRQSTKFQSEGYLSITTGSFNQEGCND